MVTLRVSHRSGLAVLGAEHRVGRLRACVGLPLADSHFANKLPSDGASSSHGIGNADQ